MHKYTARLVLVMGLLAATPAFAADHKVFMVDEGSEGNMVFEPGYLKTNVGDTVTFVVKDRGHNVISRHTPPGAEGWKGTVSTGFTVTMQKEGVYLYECDLHKMLGMVAVIQVGKPVNLDSARVAAAELSKKMAMGAERLDVYLAKVQ